MNNVFISYRRQDTAGHVGRLYDLLVKRFGRDHVFVDIDRIEAGQDFVEVLNRELASCRVLLVVIGPHWLSGAGPNGRRIDDPNDFVRLEIAEALGHELHIIPVLVHGAQMPSASELPPDIAALSRRQNIVLGERTWQQDADRLVRTVAQRVGSDRRVGVPLLAAIAVLAVAVVSVVVFLFWPRTDEGVSFEDDFTSQRRLATQRIPPECRAEYVDEGLLVEAIHLADPCEYVLYGPRSMPDRRRIEVSIKLQQAAHEIDRAAYGLRLVAEGAAGALAYRGAIVRVDDFTITELRSSFDERVLAVFAESFIRAGPGMTNQFAVEIDGRQMKWELNGRQLRTVTAAEKLGGELSTYLSGRGLQAVFRSLKVTSEPAQTR